MNQSKYTKLDVFLLISWRKAHDYIVKSRKLHLMSHCKKLQLELCNKSQFNQEIRFLVTGDFSDPFQFFSVTSMIFGSTTTLTTNLTRQFKAPLISCNNSNSRSGNSSISKPSGKTGLDFNSQKSNPNSTTLKDLPLHRQDSWRSKVAPMVLSWTHCSFSFQTFSFCFWSGWSDICCSDCQLASISRSRIFSDNFNSVSPFLWCVLMETCSTCFISWDFSLIRCGKWVSKRKFNRFFWYVAYLHWFLFVWRFTSFSSWRISRRLMNFLKTVRQIWGESYTLNRRLESEI